MLLLLFAGSGFCLGGSGGGLMGLILLNCIGLQLTGGFRMQTKPPAATLSRENFSLSARDLPRRSASTAGLGEDWGEVSKLNGKF